MQESVWYWVGFLLFAAFLLAIVLGSLTFILTVLTVTVLTVAVIASFVRERRERNASTHSDLTSATHKI